MNRASGILLHPTSLPSRQGIGTLGTEARTFIDFLKQAGQSVWQLLPFGPTGYGDSPYNALSAFAGNPLLIDLETLAETGDLDKNDLPETVANQEAVDFRAVHQACHRALQKAATNFQGRGERAERYREFCTTQSYWLEDYALFMALRERFNGQAWTAWPEALRLRETARMEEARKESAEEIKRQRYIQFVFAEQWSALKTYANDNGISLFGDLPIFVAEDSADVWARQDLFQIDEHGIPTAHAGVPPDYFSETGQLWGNPLYRWERHLEEGFSWWLTRFEYQFRMVDLVRVDHFRGFQACWSIPAGAETAIEGHWEEAPGETLFKTLCANHPAPPIIAEDLGIITTEVEALRDQFHFPGMKILQFAFDSGPDNPYLPDNYQPHCLVYTGTHDNNTTLGWWHEITDETREQVKLYLDKSVPDIPWDMIEIAMQSVAELCIIPCQDILELDEKSRFNRPGQATGNWQWRMKDGALSPQLAERLLQMVEESNRRPECN